jgi:hypothetical protein
LLVGGYPFLILLSFPDFYLLSHKSSIFHFCFFLLAKHFIFFFNRLPNKQTNKQNKKKRNKMLGGENNDKNNNDTEKNTGENKNEGKNDSNNNEEKKKRAMKDSSLSTSLPGFSTESLSNTKDSFSSSSQSYSSSGASRPKSNVGKPSPIRMNNDKGKGLAQTSGCFEACVSGKFFDWLGLCCNLQCGGQNDGMTWCFWCGLQCDVCACLCCTFCYPCYNQCANINNQKRIDAGWPWCSEGIPPNYLGE